MPHNIELFGKAFFGRMPKCEKCCRINISGESAFPKNLRFRKRNLFLGIFNYFWERFWENAGVKIGGVLCVKRITKEDAKNEG